ncbi:hypothetical protein F2Q68_00043181 [Brassica cretica]|uniref:Uncharacterized protein n=1 Tax=Brassica cretica TaxID=69181 RepID=A0A8S9LLV5_BRACR|nr:hypothetical protein F2Q68_00043181 [Brassica cretica]
MIPASEAETGSEASGIARNRVGIRIPEKLNMEAQGKLRFRLVPASEVHQSEYQLVDCRNRTTKRETRAGHRAGTDASWLLPIGSQTVLRLQAADRGTRAVAVGIASDSDVNGKLRSSRIRNALGLELIRWTRAGMPCRNKRRDRE